MKLYGRERREFLVQAYHCFDEVVIYAFFQRQEHKGSIFDFHGLMVKDGHSQLVILMAG